VVKECDNYNLENVIEKINSGIDLLGGWDTFVKPGMKVLLKVNLIGPKLPESAAVTHCEFVRGITRILKQKGCTVWIGDSAGGAIAGIAPTTQSLEISGLKKVAEEEMAEIKNFDKEGTVYTGAGHNVIDKLYLSKPLFDADFIINLPKLKTHSGCIYTGAVKNVFGCIQGLRKAEYHKAAPDPKDFGNILVDIQHAVKIGLHIMDGITAMEGEGPTAGSVYLAKKILISTDPLALDAAAINMIGLHIKDIPILQAAIERKLGESNRDNIEICGDYSELPLLENYKIPKRFTSKKKSNYNAVIKVIDFLKTKPQINFKKCQKCNTCVDSCPMSAIDKTTKKINYSKCIECMCCHELCRYEAVELKRVNPIAGIMTKLYRGNYK
jgi:uncharacterized protein (DUF362 family)/NAD-dependent dihydropyrimidine dehydrogenase PreA subunit